MAVVPIHLRNVYNSPAACENLISWGQIDAAGFVLKTEKGRLVISNSANKVVALGKKTPRVLLVHVVFPLKLLKLISGITF